MATNILQAVETYNPSALAFLQIQNPHIFYSNKKFENFNTTIYNQRGQTVSFSLPPLSIATMGTLVASFQSAQERLQTLTVDQAANIGFAFTAEEIIFFVENDTEKFVRSAINEIGTPIGKSIAQNHIDHTYRAFGDGVTPLNTFKQYAEICTNFRNYGAVTTDTMGFVSDVDIPAVIDSGLNQFVVDRNEQLARSWELGMFSGTKWFSSSVLPIQHAGTVGNNFEPLTVVSISPDGSQITFSGAAAAAIAIANGDIITLDPPGATPYVGLYYLGRNGHVVSAQKVQVRATANVASTGGNITVPIFPSLLDLPTNPGNANANINIPIVAGIKALVLPSHRAGAIMAGNPLFLAMPRLPEEIPFPTSTMSDPVSGAALRTYYGSLFGQNQHGMVIDAVWGSTLVDEFSLRIVYPLTTVLTMGQYRYVPPAMTKSKAA